MPYSSDLSDRQQKMLEMIQAYLLRFDYPPTIREIGEAVGISSTSVVTYNLDKLERKGYIRRNRDISRGINLSGDWYDQDLLDRGRAAEAGLLDIPVLGAIAAGEPIPVPEDLLPEAAESISVTTDMVGDADQVYALEVHGESMIGDLINDGDIVIMRHQTTARNGDTVAAWLKDEKATTLKRIYQQPGSNRVRLQPANPAMQPIEVSADNLEIQGKVICVIRKLA
jgi:repressor LexA